MRSLAFVAEKGGVGKTTCAVNLAVAMAKRGVRVLFVDADPQGNASLVLLAGRGGPGPTLADVLANDVDARDAVRAARTPGLDVIPPGAALADVNVSLAAELGREHRLRLGLSRIGGYDVVIVDTPPTRSLLVINVLAFVREVYCPVDPGIFALAGVVSLQETIAGVARFLDNPTLALAGLIVSRANRDNLTRDTETGLREAFGPLVLRAVVPSSAKIGEAHARHMSVLDYAPGSPGAKAFKAMATEIIDGQDERAGIGGVGTAQGDDPAGAGRRPRGRRAG